MTARPVARRHGAGLQRHADAVALVEAGAAHLGEVPAGPQIACPPGGVGLEAAAGEHHGPGVDLHRAAVYPRAHACDAAIAREQGLGLRLVVDGDARPCRSLVERRDEPRPAAPGLDGEPAPEAEAPAALEGLAAVAGLEAHAVPAQPEQGGMAAGDELLDQVGVGAVLAEPRQVVVIGVRRVGPEIRLRQLALGKIGHQRAQRVAAVEDHPHGAGGVGAVAAAFRFRRGLQQPHAGARLGCRKRGRERGVAAAHDHDIGVERLAHPASAILMPTAVRPIGRSRSRLVSALSAG